MNSKLFANFVGRWLRARLVDDRGAVMLEFVLVAPILCYLIASILFFRTQIDYAQDQSYHTRHWTWEKALPDTATGINNAAESDADKFFQAPVFLKLLLRVNAIQGIGASPGPLLAIARYLGGTGFGLPYETLKLKVKNYIDTYNDIDKRFTDWEGNPTPVPPEPWSRMMGGFGQWFASQIGTGDHTVPNGLKEEGWKDRYPFIVNPWMRQYSDELDAFHYSIPFLDFLNMGLVWNVIDAFNLFRTPLLRFDGRDDMDVGENATDDWPGTFGFRYSISFMLNGDCDQLKLTSVTSSGTIADIVK